MKRTEYIIKNIFRNEVTPQNIFQEDVFILGRDGCPGLVLGCGLGLLGSKYTKKHFAVQEHRT